MADPPPDKDPPLPPPWPADRADKLGLPAPPNRFSRPTIPTSASVGGTTRRGREPETMLPANGTVCAPDPNRLAERPGWRPPVGSIHSGRRAARRSETPLPACHTGSALAAPPAADDASGPDWLWPRIQENRGIFPGGTARWPNSRSGSALRSPAPPTRPTEHLRRSRK